MTLHPTKLLILQTLRANPAGMERAALEVAQCKS